MDHMTVRDLFRGPGQDTRQWISYGFVRENGEAGAPVRFDDEDGNPLPVGPLVDVILQPSGIPVSCRVGSDFAGEGEGTWSPFVERDEVLVAIPEGDEMAQPVIIARLNNQLDAFPTACGGSDTSKNNFMFRRMRAPYVVETGSAYLVRNGSTGAQFGLTQDGNVIFNDGQGARFFMGGDVVGFSLPADGASFQLLASGKQALITAGDSVSFLFDPTLTKFTTPGVLNFGTSGFAGVGHGLTVEQLVVFVEQVITALGSTHSGSPSDTVTFGDLNLANAIKAISAAIPITGTFVINPAYVGALALTMAIPPDPFGIKPGLGRAGFVL